MLSCLQFCLIIEVSSFSEVPMMPPAGLGECMVPMAGLGDWKRYDRLSQVSLAIFMVFDVAWLA